NSTINLLNLHSGIHALAMNAGGTFFVVFLLKAGVSTPAVLASVAFIFAGRVLVRPLLLLFATRLGLRPLVALRTIRSALLFPLLAEVHGVGLALVVACVVTSIGETFYWTTYHAYFASLGDAEHRGHQIGAREAISSLAAIVGPLVGGWALATLGPRIAFGVVSMVQILSAVPFAGTPTVAVARSLPGAYRAAWRGVSLFAADGWIGAGHFFVWPIALFVSLGESFTAFGGAVALAGLVGAAAGLLLGRHIDAGHGVRAARLACGSYAALTVLRALRGQCRARGRRQRLRRDRGLHLHPDADDRRLQPGQACAVPAAVSHRDRGRLGFRRRRRMPGRGRADGAGLPLAIAILLSL